MRERAIDRSLLPADMSVRVPEDGEYGGCYSEPVQIGHVRFEAASAIRPDQYTFSAGSKGLVFVDAVNSDGAFEIPVGSLVAIGGEEMAVVAVNRYETFFGRVHHWEIEVR